MAPTRKNLFLPWKTGELKIRCEVDSGHVTENEKTVSLDDIYKLDRNVVNFLVKATGDADVYFKINMHLHYDEKHSFKVKYADGDTSACTNLQLPSTTTSIKPEGATSSSTESSASLKRKHAAQIGSELQDSPTRLADPLLYDIAEEIENDEHLNRLMHALEVTNASQTRCHESNRLEGLVTTKGTYQMLSNWRAEIAPIEQQGRLKDALTRARLFDLRGKFFPG